MKKSPELNEQRIIKRIKADYGLDVPLLTPLSNGADLGAVSFKTQSLDGKAYFVKLKKDHAVNINAPVTQFLLEKGIQHILRPLLAVTDKTSKILSEYSVEVYPFIEGADGFTKPLTENQWIELGETLRQIHELEIPDSLQNLLLKENLSSKYRQSVRSLYSHIEKGITGDSPAQSLIAYMDKHRDLITKLIIYTENLYTDIKDITKRFVLCHSDLHGGNILIDKNGQFYIIDWNSPIMAFKERDLMFIGGGVANVWNNPKEVEYFYTGYGKTEINNKLLAYYRCERIVEDIAKFGNELILKKESSVDRDNLFRMFQAMFDPNGAVDIAFKTVKDL